MVFVMDWERSIGLDAYEVILPVFHAPLGVLSQVSQLSRRRGRVGRLFGISIDDPFDMLFGISLYGLVHFMGHSYNRDVGVS